MFLKRIYTFAAIGILAALVMHAPWAKAGADEGGQVNALLPKPKLQFAVISDIHVQHWAVASHLRFNEALQDLSDTIPDAQALVVNGDLGNGQQADYDLLGKLMQDLPHPEQVLYNIGNHEFYQAWVDRLGRWNPNAFPNGETEADSINRYLGFTGYTKVYHDHWLEGYHFLFLGSEAYRQSDPDHNEDAWLSPEQLKWFEAAIAEKAEEGRPIFVFLHQPLPHTVAGSDSYVNNRAVIQHEELRAILSRYPQAILFSGHTHYELSSAKTYVRDGFSMINSSSVYSPHNEDDLPYETGDKMSEGLTVEVYGDGVRVRGRNFAQREWVPRADFTIPVLTEKAE